MTQRLQDNELSREVVAQYLVSELEMLHQRAEASEQFVANKTNFFVALTTAIVGGLLFLFKEHADESTTILVVVFALGFLLVMGWVVFKQSVDMVASAAIYYRRAGRIRQWFVDNAPTVEKYIPFTVTDERPPLYVPHAPLRDFNTIVASLNAGLVSILAGYLFFISSQTRLSPISRTRLVVVLAGSLFVIMFYVQFRIYKNHLMAKEKSEKEQGKVHFPRPN